MPPIWPERLTKLHNRTNIKCQVRVFLIMSSDSVPRDVCQYTTQQREETTENSRSRKQKCVKRCFQYTITGLKFACDRGVQPSVCGQGFIYASFRKFGIDNSVPDHLQTATMTRRQNEVPAGPRAGAGGLTQSNTYIA